MSWIILETTRALTRESGDPLDYCRSRWALLFPVMPLSGGRGMLPYIINSLTVSSCLCPPRYCTFDDDAHTHTHSLSLSLSVCNLHTNDLQNGLLTSPCILTWDGLLVEREDILDLEYFLSYFANNFFCVCRVMPKWMGINGIRAPRGKAEWVQAWLS